MQGTFDVGAVRAEFPEPACDYVPDELETGTQNHEGIAGVEGALGVRQDGGFTRAGLAPYNTHE